jgi:hypothetical protein
MNHEQARKMARNAMAAGKITKPSSCSRCGCIPRQSELDGHHPDYDRPLDIVWLCSNCHVNEHYPNRAGKPRQKDTKYTAVRIYQHSYDKLKVLADKNKRSMSRMLEVLVDEALEQVK